jgi:hypothetical protein
MSAEFQKFLDTHGIHHERTIPHTPQMNGVAERVNRTIVEGIVTNLAGSGLPQHMWDKAAAYVTGVKNLSPHAGAANDIPARLWAGQKPSTMPFKPFGCRAIARNTNPGRRKLDKRG